ncbi:MAG: class I SAM-dependent methyltransferase [Bacteroidales bacterium]|nr:class I SAM-dependent methyltransferase [Bacteroidales bacterium]
MNLAEKQKEVFWSRFAADFEERNNYVAGHKEIGCLKKHLSENKNLGKTLELGCGDGVFTQTIASNSEKVVATDWSEEMLQVTGQRFINHTNIEVKKENCLGLSFSDNSFDTVFMANLLHIVPTPEKALEECKRVLKPGGSLIILSFTLHGMGIFNKLGMLYRYVKTYGKPPKDSRKLTVANVNDLLEKAGFEVKTISLIGDRMKSVYAIAGKKETTIDK